MKKNMQKVPGIQKESAAYHQQEAVQADQMLENAIVQTTKPSAHQRSIATENKNKTKQTWRRQLFAAIKSFL